jgi:hypothetical protein
VTSWEEAAAILSPYSGQCGVGIKDRFDWGELIDQSNISSEEWDERALRYLENQTDEDGCNEFAAYSALMWLAKREKAGDHPPLVKKWMRLVLKFAPDYVIQPYRSDASVLLIDALMNTLRTHYSAAFATAIMETVEPEAQHSENIPLFDGSFEVFDDIVSPLINLLGTGITLGVKKQITQRLLEKNDTSVIEKLISLLRELVTQPERGEEYRVYLASVLLVSAKEQKITAVLDLIDQFPHELTVKVMECFSSRTLFSREWSSGWPVNQLARLYKKIVNLFPYEDDVHHTGAHVMNTRDEVQWCKNSLPQIIAGMGSLDAVRALERLATDLPDLSGKLLFAKLEAATLARQRGWKPLPPEELIRKLNMNPSIALPMGAHRPKTWEGDHRPD